ncbi:hypothetical protein KFE25_003813 [Diacronema lutheri]|uniref:Uncharacterized protein n=2 Tax=Diacronema lutheri TaxID=2081491 RepID=A0A8J5XQC6_DIALT|nr:hypothetical protein KFE25_003813 [Diacronema lutheri]
MPTHPELDRVSTAAVSQAYAELGQWVRRTNYKLTQDEWIWLNQARMNVLRAQASYAGFTFCGVLAATHVKFSIGSGPPRRLPGWSRWGIAGLAAWMASGFGKLSGHRMSMKRLMLIPDSRLGEHMRKSLSLPPLAEQPGASFGDELADGKREFAPHSPRVAGVKDEREQPFATVAEGTADDARFGAPAGAAAAGNGPLQPALGRPPPRGANQAAAPERPNSWDRVRQQRLERNAQQLAADGASRDSPFGRAGDALPAQMRGDGSVEAGLPRVLAGKNRWGDKVLSDTLE